MISTFFEARKDTILLVARLLFSLLFIIFGWQKLVGFAATVAYMTSLGLPAPEAAAVVAIAFELGLGVAIALGFWTRPAALWLALYSVATAAIAHRYWMMTGAEQYMNTIHFYKNMSIAGGALLLCLTGPGKYSVDTMTSRRTP
jgi:putative oxidoreductase